MNASRIGAAEKMTAQLGPSKFATLYDDLCEQYLAAPPGETFKGQVVLTEK